MRLTGFLFFLSTLVALASCNATLSRDQAYIEIIDQYKAKGCEAVQSKLHKLNATIPPEEENDIDFLLLVQKCAPSHPDAGFDIHKFIFNYYPHSKQWRYVAGLYKQQGIYDEAISKMCLGAKLPAIVSYGDVYNRTWKRKLENLWDADHEVLMDLTISPQGEVIDAKVTHHSGKAVFKEYVLAKAKKSVWCPGDKVVQVKNERFRWRDSKKHRAYWMDRGWGTRAYETGNYKKAARYFEKAADKGSLRASRVMAILHAEGKGVEFDCDKAKKYASTTIDDNPDNWQRYWGNGYAWVLAICPDNTVEDGREALAILEDVLKLPRRQNQYWVTDTLAAAQARAGNFEQAVSTQEKAIKELEAFIEEYRVKSYRDLVDTFEARLTNYKEGKPWSFDEVQMKSKRRYSRVEALNNPWILK